MTIVTARSDVVEKNYDGIVLPGIQGADVTRDVVDGLRVQNGSYSCKLVEPRLSGSGGRSLKR